MKPIIIEEYSSQWPVYFEMLRSIYAAHLKDMVSDIEHVGSTSVLSMSAKPVIDIDLIIGNRNILPAVIVKLEMLGYEYACYMGIRDREAFRQRSNLTPEDGSKREWPLHNLYVCLKDTVALRNHLALRDYLRANVEKAKQYSELKKKLATENPYDIDLYIKNKTPLITEILKEIGFDKEAIDRIKKDNGL